MYSPEDVGAELKDSTLDLNEADYEAIATILNMGAQEGDDGDEIDEKKLQEALEARLAARDSVAVEEQDLTVEGGVVLTEEEAQERREG